MPVSRPFADSVDQKTRHKEVRRAPSLAVSGTSYLLFYTYFQYGSSEAWGLCCPRLLYQYLYSIAHPYLANDGRRGGRYR